MRLHLQAQHAVVSAVIATAATRAGTLVIRRASTNGSAPSRTTSTARIPKPTPTRAYTHSVRMMELPCSRGVLLVITVATFDWFTATSPSNLGEDMRDLADGVVPRGQQEPTRPCRLTEAMTFPSVI